MFADTHQLLDAHNTVPCVPQKTWAALIEFAEINKGEKAMPFMAEPPPLPPVPSQALYVHFH